MKRLKGKPIAFLLTLVLIAAASAGTALAYFSDYETAMGQATLQLAGQTEIDEGNDDSQKQIVIKNTGEADVVVRVAVFGPDQTKVTAPAGWENHGDFYYYKKVLPAAEAGQESTTGEPIVAELNFTGTEDEIAAQKALLGDAADITVIHESAPAVYDSQGKVQKPDGWDYIPDISGPAVEY